MPVERNPESLFQEDSMVHGWEHTFEPRGQGFNVEHHCHYEIALCNPDHLEAWIYTDRFGYRAGDTVRVHGSTTAEHLTLEFYRNGNRTELVNRVENLTGESVPMPDEGYATGCNWPVVYEWETPEDLPSGFYLIRVTGHSVDGKTVEHEHGVFVRPGVGQKKSDILFIGSTATWVCYNDWGGANHYVSHRPYHGNHSGSPVVSSQRPLGRGFVWTPEGAPRLIHEERPPINWSPRYPCFEWAYAKGFSKYYACAGWATHERYMCKWAEANGYQFDYACQHDLHQFPDLLDDYRCIVMVGHCEYWSEEMRDAVDRFVENGGNVARFAGNMAGKILLEGQDCQTLTCYNLHLNDDPNVAAGKPELVSGMWGDAFNQRPSTSTFGLDWRYGVMGRFGSYTPRGAGGFTVYRPDHWALDFTDLYYGDSFGDAERIVGFECDGLDYTFRDGLPYPIEGQPGLPEDVEIIAMALASNDEADHGQMASSLFHGNGGLAIPMAAARYGDLSPQSVERAKTGSSMVVTFTRGKGNVFHAGTCEWVYGLKYRDPFTEQITRNVLNRFTGGTNS